LCGGNFIIWHNASLGLSDANFLRFSPDSNIILHDSNVNIRNDGQLQIRAGTHTIGDVFRMDPNIHGDNGTLENEAWTFVEDGADLTVSRMRQNVVWVEGNLLITGDSNIQTSITSDFADRYGRTTIGCDANVHVYWDGNKDELAAYAKSIQYAVSQRHLVVNGMLTIESNLVIGIRTLANFGYPQDVCNTGSLSVRDDEIIGFAVDGNYLQTGTGSSHTVGGSLYVGHSGGTGAFEMSGGALTVGGNIYLGGNESSAGGTGYMRLSGGTTTVGGSVRIWQLGTLIIGGGSIACSNGPLDVTNDGNVYIGIGASAVLGIVANADSNFLLGNVTVEDNATLTVSGLNQATVYVGNGAVLNLGGPGSSGNSMQGLQGSTTLQSVQTPTISHAQWLVNRRCLVFKDSNVADQLGMDRWVNDYQIAHGLATGIGIVMESVLGYATFGRFTGLDGNDVLERFTDFGDCNLDGNVDAADYAMFAIGLANQANFGTSAYDANFVGWAYGDFNYDGVVDGSDSDLMELGYDGWLASLGQENLLTASPGVVPEPASLTLLAVLGLGLPRRRTRR
jgi:hypothetical protein